jgi:hypothetical protein
MDFMNGHLIGNFFQARFLLFQGMFFSTSVQELDYSKGDCNDGKNFPCVPMVWPPRQFALEVFPE